MQVTWQVAPLVQLTLPLFPTVIEQTALSQLKLPLSPAVRSQLLPLLQSILHEGPQAPLQVLPELQVRLQLWVVVSQPVDVQVAPALQAQIIPVQAQAEPGHGEDAVLLLQALSATTISDKKTVLIHAPSGRVLSDSGRELRGSRNIGGG